MEIQCIDQMRERKRDRERQRETDRDRERQRETGRETERDRERQRVREKERATLIHATMVTLSSALGKFTLCALYRGFLSINIGKKLSHFEIHLSPISTRF